MQIGKLRAARASGDAGHAAAVRECETAARDVDSTLRQSAAADAALQACHSLVLTSYDNTLVKSSTIRRLIHN